MSAGSLCWFAEAATGFHGEDRRVEGLGLLPWSNAVHYDEAGGTRRDAYHRFLAEGMAPGYAAENGAALHFVEQKLRAVVSSKPAARAYRVEAIGDEVIETGLDAVYLGAEDENCRPQVRVAA